MMPILRPEVYKLHLLRLFGSCRRWVGSGYLKSYGLGGPPAQ